MTVRMREMHVLVRKWVGGGVSALVLRLVLGSIPGSTNNQCIKINKENVLLLLLYLTMVRPASPLG